MGRKISQFPAATTASDNDVLAGVQSNSNKKFSLSVIWGYISGKLGNTFVPQTRTVNNKALSSNIVLDASDVGAVDTVDIGVADGVASLDSTGKVPGKQLDLSNTQNKIIANGILKGDGAGGVSAAVAGTDYQAPLTAGTDYATPDQLAYVESGTTASRAYAVGEYFCWNGLLYRVIAPISSGGTFTPGTNCKQVTEGGLNRLNEPIKINRQVLATSISTGLNTLTVAPTAISGYKAIGVAGVQFASTDRTKLNLVEFLLDGGQYIIVQFNSTYTKASGCSVAAFVIYAKE